MLRELRIRDLAVVAEACLEAGEGFTVLTGETGAGKSVCVAALRGALGGRLDADAVRPGASSACVSAVFDSAPAPARGRLAQLGVPDDDLLTLTREVVPGGRGSCRINGALVSLSVLREVGESVADVTVQGASQRLLRRTWQRDILDAACPQGLVAAGRVEAAVSRWRDAESGLAAATEAARAGGAAVERAREVISDLHPLRLRAGEEAELAAERTRLAHAAGLLAAADTLACGVGGDETGGADVVATAVAAARASAAADPELAGIVEEAAELAERLRQVALDARRFAASVTLDERRLAEVEARLDAIARVTRVHGSLETALRDLAAAEALVAAYDGGEAGLARQAQEAAAARAEAIAAAAELSSLRAAGARALERAVTAELRTLALPYARFRVVLRRTPDATGVDTGDGVPVRCGRHGVDEVEFRLVANRDMLPLPLDQGPSGGELSRLALALAAVVSEEAAPLLVLDEVDTGIGGETAARVGDVLARIGRDRQVLAVTHRPEIAARAATHVVIRKREEALGTRAAVALVAGEERAEEVARLMSGRTTRAALARARELLAEGRPVEAQGRRAAARTM